MKLYCYILKYNNTNFFITTVEYVSINITNYDIV